MAGEKSIKVEGASTRGALEPDRQPSKGKSIEASMDKESLKD